MSPNKHAPKYEEWQEQYNWSTCKTGREQYGKFLISILTSEMDGHVLNLNGAWGTGKTEFLKRIYVSLAENEYPVVYIDAWESDFIKDPLTVICSEFLNQLGFTFANNDEGKFEEIKKELNTLMARISSISQIITPLGSLYKSYDPSASEGIDFASALLEISKIDFKRKCGVIDNNASLIERMLGSQMELVEGMKDIRKQITAISGILERVYELKTPIIVLVDELDRCRPDYAIKMLEVVKHFFDVKGCNFLIATDTESLQESIKAVYGSNFDAERYLRRFFNQRIALQRPSIQNYIKQKEIDYLSLCGRVKLAPFSEDNEGFVRFLSCLLDRQTFELRDIERFIQKLIASLRFIDNNNLKKESSINLAILAYAILEHEVAPSNFFTRKNNIQRNVMTVHGSLNELLSLSDFISIQLMLVVTQPSDMTNNLKGSKQRLIPRKNVLIAQGTEINLLRRGGWGKCAITDETSELTEVYMSEPESYWMWEDYQKIVGLTDAIE
ncbi:KAP family P-loop NTPase fold protein [Vibrio diabolicus]|uniref:KAP family P-loop NTPase fold protein n=1 Tax=Vibrio diabolicus TaxID=50719 RepID=UPI0035A8A223